MRLLTFSFLKNCKWKSIWLQSPRKISNDTVQSKILENITGDPDLIYIHPSWKADEEPELRAAIMNDMQVLPDFVTEAEEASLLAELEPYLKRMRYEFDHWDDAIQGFRETERSRWSAVNGGVLSRVRATAFAASEPLPHVHVLDLAAAGHIKPHIDAVRFCGEVIAGVSLLSAAVMRLQHAQRHHLQFDALLPQRSLYIMRGAARYQFTHAVCGGDGEQSTWRGEVIRRRRRVALITRSQPRAQDAC
ncbi:alpha-ketoglutarate-dependent dioxygenase alkB homolog 7, mitochondrial [Galleria mellonella]|uniref:Alpha-ketoglutarate-dependent dioxygenase alkB homolog 7, mitochondrial n=1 Tax=Galleria mellonella TaxID=7137 RepID=A0A6J1WBS8_GALME|nr:alpha-ketoglutarate-dependent dioxygenase alkB homolog 7, mitochondrial [Galleria mellonella]